MFGYIYMTTNTINGKRYIGQKTAHKFLGNSYLGSGEALQLAIQKYGKNNFEVVMIEECSSRHDLNIREAFYISKYNAVQDENFYNMKEGGHGGSVKGACTHSTSYKQMMSQRMSGRNNPNYGNHVCKLSKEYREKMSIKFSGKGNPNYGKHHDDRTRELISQKAKGRIWINNGLVTKHIKPEYLSEYVDKGWLRGRLPYSSTTIESVSES